MLVERMTPDQWSKYSETAHLLAFGEYKPVEDERIDFALIVHEKDRFLGYVTCKELDGKTLYWQFGGAFPGTGKTLYAWLSIQALVRWAMDSGYERVGCMVENTNSPMLKMAAKLGFLITGVRNFKGSVLLEHALEFEGK